MELRCTRWLVVDVISQSCHYSFSLGIGGIRMEQFGIVERRAWVYRPTIIDKGLLDHYPVPSIWILRLPS